MSTDTRTTYETPALTVLGTLEAVTQQTLNGSRFDANFSAGQQIPAGGIAMS